MVCYCLHPVVRYKEFLRRLPLYPCKAAIAVAKSLCVFSSASLATFWKFSGLVQLGDG